MSYFKNLKVLDIESNSFVTIFLTDNFYNIHIFSCHLESEPFDPSKNYNFEQIGNATKIKFKQNFIFILNSGLIFF